MKRSTPVSMAQLQESDYGADRDYSHGSPHLTHPALRDMIEGQLVALVEESIARTGSCRVLEVGAGHGTFTETMVSAGAQVTVTEMSRPSATLLEAKFADNPAVTVAYDPDASLGSSLVAAGCDLIVFVSVLHHIPDYVATVDELVAQLGAGGAFYSAQDPLFYPSMKRRERVADRGSYFLWRLGQGDVRRGVATRVRRLRGQYSESEPSDMVEYHVVRQGVDQDALKVMLKTHFGSTEIFKYWSTQSGLLQSLGTRGRLMSNFAIVARERW